MEAPRILSEEQRHILGTTFHFIESATYFRSILPVVDEVDERLLSGLVDLGEICLKRLPQFFTELQPLAEEWKRRSSNG